MGKYHDLLQAALENKLGLYVQCDDVEAAKLLRRNLYRERERARLAGRSDFEELSFLLEGPSIKIVKKSKVFRVNTPQYMTRPLTLHELPTSICARGFARPQLSAILMHSMMVEELQNFVSTATKQDLLKLIPPLSKKR